MSELRIAPLQNAGAFSYAGGSGFNFAVRYLYPQDLNGDGRDEVIFAGFETQYNTPENYTNTRVSIFGWQGNQFQDLTTQYLPNGIDYVEGVGDIAFGDFNADGLIDVYVSGNADMEYSINAYAFINRGSSFDRINLGLTKWEHGVAAGDINRDGYDDIVVAGYVHPSPFLLGGANGLTKLLVEDGYAFNSYATYGSGVAIADFLDNGTNSLVVVDIAIANGSVNDTKLMEVVTDHAGTPIGFLDVNTLPTPRLDLSSVYQGTQTPPLSHDVRARAFDFSNDGLTDVLVFSRAAFDGNRWPEVSQLQFLLNCGNGQFIDVTTEYLLGYDKNSNISYNPIIEDINGDGLTDIFLSESSWDGAHNSTTLILAQQDGSYVDSFRQELSALIEPRGGMSTLIRSGENQYALVTESQAFGGNTPVQIAALSFPDRDLSESLRGTIADNLIYGMGGSDTISGVEGNDHINGGDGIDYSNYRSALVEYVIEVSVNQLAIVSDHLPERDGTDTLANVERLQFSDVMVGLDSGVGENAGMAYRLYKAAFDRTPDLGGVGYWIKRFDQGLGLGSAAQEFINSGEFKSLYGDSSTNQEFVGLLYQHVMHRPAEGEGFNFWVNALSPQGGWSRSSVLAYFSESDENLGQTAELVANGIQYNVFVAS